MQFHEPKISYHWRALVIRCNQCPICHVKHKHFHFHFHVDQTHLIVIRLKPWQLNWKEDNYRIKSYKLWLWMLKISSISIGLYTMNTSFSIIIDAKFYSEKIKYEKQHENQFMTMITFLDAFGNRFVFAFILMCSFNHYNKYEYKKFKNWQQMQFHKPKNIVPLSSGCDSMWLVSK